LWKCTGINCQCRFMI